MSEKITYYKVIGSDNKSCHGGDFDWTEYLPKNGKPGKWTPKIDAIEECSSGYHITRYWNMWYSDGCQIFECEFKGLQAPCDTGVVEKGVASSIRLVRKFNPSLIARSNTGKWNTGDWNTGIRNTGDFNTGDLNTGDFNTGDLNTGDFNTGDLNTGNFNTGNFNTGDSNTGIRNSGNRNAGDWNAGDWNAGDMNTGNRNTGAWNSGGGNSGNWNSGYRNSGNYNSGNRNSGDGNSGTMNNGHRNSGNRNSGDGNSGNWNSANQCSGHFNTITPDTIMVFNKPCRTTEWEGAILPRFLFNETQGTYLESWRSAYDGATNDEKRLLVRLPNFDADVFYEISGIKVNPENGQEVK